MKAKSQTTKSKIDWSQLYLDLPENIALVLREKRIKPEKLTSLNDGEILALGLSDTALETIRAKHPSTLADTEKKVVKVEAKKEVIEKDKPVSTSHFAKYPSHVHGRSKHYRALAKKINRNQTLAPKEALEKLIALAGDKRTIDLHLNVTDTGLRGEVKVPFSTGKNIRVEIFSDKTITALNNNEFGFDILLATPADMPKLAKYAKILGPKGLMPNPKSGTVTADPEGRAKQLSAGATIAYKTEPKFPIIHVSLGKTSQKPDELLGNLTTLLKEIGTNKITTAYLTANQIPAVRLDLSSLS